MQKNDFKGYTFQITYYYRSAIWETAKNSINLISLKENVHLTKKCMYSFLLLFVLLYTLDNYLRFFEINLWLPICRKCIFVYQGLQFVPDNFIISIHVFSIVLSDCLVIFHVHITRRFIDYSVLFHSLQSVSDFL